MANQKIGLDVSDLKSGAQAAVAAFQGTHASLGELVDIMIKFNAKGEQTRATLTYMNQAGVEHDVVVRKIGSGWRATMGTMGTAANIVNDLRKAIQGLEQGSGERFTLTFAGIVRLLERQTIHKVFSEITAEISRSIGQAIEFQQVIARISAVPGRGSAAQNTTSIQSLATEFKMPQMEVAKAALAAFQSQAMTTAKDTHLLGDALKYAKITGEDATQSVKTLTSAMEAFRIPVNDSGKVLDIMTKLSMQTGISSHELQSVMGTLGNTARGLGIRIEEVAAALATFRAQGLSGHESINLLTSIMTTLERPSQELTKLFGTMGIESGRMAIEHLRLVGVMELFDKEAEKGGGRVGELEKSFRAMRAGAALGSDAIATMKSKLDEVTTGTADKLLGNIDQTVGEKLKGEFNQIGDFFTNEFGTKIIAAVEAATRPFGGFAAVVKEASQSVVLLFNALSSAVRIFQAIITLGGNLNVSMTTLVITFVAYKAAVLAMAAAKAVYTTALISMTGATVTATEATITLGMVGKAAFAGLAAGALLIAIQAINDGITKGTKELQKFKVEVDQISKSQDKRLDNQRKSDTADTDNFRKELDRRYGVLYEFNRRSLESENKTAVDRKNLVKDTTERLKEENRVVLDSMNKTVSDLRKAISEADRNVKDSQKNIVKFGDKDSKTGFSAALGAEEDSTQKIFLIRTRMRELQSDIAKLSDKGDKESIESARRKYEEIRGLTIQQFTLETGLKKQRVAAGLEAGDGARIDPITGRVKTIVEAPVPQLNSNLKKLRDAEIQTEQRFQAEQAKTSANTKVQLEAERRRQTAIADATKELLKFRLTDDQGKVRKEFSGEGGVKRAQDELLRLENNVKKALDPTRGKEVSVEEVVRFYKLINDQRLALEKQLQSEINKIQIQASNERITREKAAMTKAYSDLKKQAVDQTAARDEKVQESLGQIGTIKQEAVSSGTFLPTSAKFEALRKKVQELADAAATAVKQFNLDPTAKTAEAARLAIAQLEAQYRKFLGVKYGSEKVPGTNFTGDELSSGKGEVKARGIAEGFGKSVADLSATNAKIKDAYNQLLSIDQKLAGLPASMQPAIQAFRDLGVTIEQSLGNAATRFGALATSIERLAASIQRVNGGGKPGIVGNPDFITPEGFAEGGPVPSVNWASHGTDTIPAMLTEGEYVMPEGPSSKFFPLLEDMRRGRLPRYYAEGGPVSNTSVGDVTINVNGESTPEATARKVMSSLRREFRRGNGKLN